MTVSPGTHLLQGQSLTLTLESSPKVNDLSIECTCPRKRNFKSPKAITVPNLSIQDDGTWQCTVTVNKQKDTLSIKIFVLGKRLRSS